MARRNPYKPGTRSHAEFREKYLRRRERLARANASRAKSLRSRKSLLRKASAARYEIRKIEKMQEFRSHLNERDRRAFDKLPLKEQREFKKISTDFPETVPQSITDPFGGSPSRQALWRLYYATRAGIRLHHAA
jgi:hypothetical protein